MTCRNENRKRSLTIAFRVTPELNEEINMLVAASGMTKQDFIVSRLKGSEITVLPSVNFYNALRGEMRDLCKQLNRFRDNENPPEELIALCDKLADIFLGLRGCKTTGEVENEDASIFGLERC